MGVLNLPREPQGGDKDWQCQLPGGSVCPWTVSLSDQAFKVCDPWVTCIRTSWAGS